MDYLDEKEIKLVEKEIDEFVKMFKKIYYDIDKDSIKTSIQHYDEKYVWFLFEYQYKDDKRKEQWRYDRKRKTIIL